VNQGGIENWFIEDNTKVDDLDMGDSEIGNVAN